MTSSPVAIPDQFRAEGFRFVKLETDRARLEGTEGIEAQERATLDSFVGCIRGEW